MSYLVFFPLDTPILERQEIISAKISGETEKQLYAFQKGDENLSMRFDLTVPLARYVSEHFHELVFPFRRYQIGKVYRGERPQKGRFREFYQADIDIIGQDSLGVDADAEVLSAVATVFNDLKLGSFTLRLNHRRILNGLFESLKIQNKAIEVLHLVDKLEKVGAKIVKEELLAISVSAETADVLLDVLSWDDKPIKLLQRLREADFSNEEIIAGVEDLELIVAYLKSSGLSDDCYKIDLSIARGLDYYTGMVFETKLNDYPQLGSICSGGRYENLAECYTDKKLPGVGASIGVSRLFSQLRELGLWKDDDLVPAKVLIVAAAGLDFAAKTAAALRAENISVQVLVDPKIKKGLSFANKTKIPFVIILGEDEVKNNFYNLKEMLSGKQYRANNLSELLKIIQ